MYLPKSVSADRVEDRYPLGASEDGYQMCHDGGIVMERIGYYFVRHPLGDYCERKP